MSKAVCRKVLDSRLDRVVREYLKLLGQGTSWVCEECIAHNHCEKSYGSLPMENRDCGYIVKEFLVGHSLGKDLKRLLC